MDKMMLIKGTLAVTLIAPLLTVLAGCSHARLERDLEAKLAREPEVKSTTTLRDEATTLLNGAAGLTEAQKTEIRALWSETRAKTDALNQTSLKLRALLIMDLAQPETTEREMNLIKKRLSDTENDRLSLYFASVRETNRILGRWGSSEERYRFFEEMDFADHMR